MEKLVEGGKGQACIIMEGSFFRKEALENKKTPYGTIFMNAPANYYWIAGGVFIAMLALILFILLASFSEKFKARGYINSTKGVVRIYPNKNGLIKKCYLKQGQKVDKGAVLFLIDTQAASLSSKPYRKMMDHLEKKRTSLQREILYKTEEIKQLKHLLEQQHISRSFFHQKQAVLSTLRERKNALQLDILRQQQSRSYEIRSPIKGSVASVLFHPGEFIHTNKVIAKILPENSKLIAEIFVPIPHAGFLRKNDPVLIHYDAYPAGRFGPALATVEEISLSILTDEEEDKPFLMREPYYKVKARLNSQSLSLYGKERAILHGMTFSAVIIGAKKKLWQWMLDPLYSYYGKLSR